MSKKNANTLADGALYMRRRNVSPAHSSSLKKLRTGARIAHGLRPFKMPRRQLHPVAFFPDGLTGGGVLMLRPFDLHPTKGFRTVPEAKAVFREVEAAPLFPFAPIAPVEVHAIPAAA